MVVTDRFHCTLTSCEHLQHDAIGERPDLSLVIWSSVENINAEKILLDDNTIVASAMNMSASNIGVFYECGLSINMENEQVELAEIYNQMSHLH